MTVHDVLAILEEEEFFTQADVYITPPGDGNDTDKDSADEEGGIVDNLSGRQLNSTAVATV